VDLIVSCVDSAAARHEVNKFSRRFLIPLIDVGATDDTSGITRISTGFPVSYASRA